MPAFRKQREQIRLGAKRQLTLPRRVVSELKLREGDLLEWQVEDGRMELVPMALIPRDQLWFWTPEWQAKEREAGESIKKGRYKTYKNMKEALASLKS